MASEDVVVIKNSKGQNLFGILHVPDNSHIRSTRIGINLLNPGLKNRVAPNRLNVKIARALVQKGYYVLRMDPAGIGDSEGEIAEDQVADIWGEIQQGMLAQDVKSMNDYFLETCKLDRLILMGSCGGAISALLCAEQDHRVSSLILIDVPVTLSSTKTITDKYLNIIETNDSYRSWLTSSYLHSLLNPRKWWRFITLKSDYRAIKKVISLQLKEKVKKRYHASHAAVVSEIANWNPNFIRAFIKMMSHKIMILFICGEKDHDTQLFYKGFVDVYLKPGETDEFKDYYVISEIKDANHIYTLTSSQNDLIDEISQWLSQNYDLPEEINRI